MSVNSAFSLDEFRHRNGIEFAYGSGFENELVDDYDVATDFADLGVCGLAQRSVFVIEPDGTITHDWVSDDPGGEPDSGTIERRVDDTA